MTQASYDIDRDRRLRADGKPLGFGPDAVAATATDSYVVADAAGVIVAWNRQAEITFGWTTDEAVGRDLALTIGGVGFRSAVALSPDQWASAAPGPAHARRIELDARHRRGRSLPVEIVFWVTLEANGPALHLLAHDISDRHHLQERAYRMARLMYSLDEAVLSVRSEGTILSWNSGAERIFGYRPWEVVGEPLSVLFDADRRDEVGGWWQALRDGGPPQRHETRGVRSNGVAVDLAITMSLIRWDDGTLCDASLIARDITEQRWTAETLETTLGSLEKALGETRESERRCRQFLADAAHQLRTPMAGIRASAETLLRGSTPAQRDQLLLNVVRETSRAGRVMTGLSAMARVDQGERLIFRPSDLAALCTEEANRSQALAPQLDIEVRVSARPASPPELDANVIREILANLLDNARRHSVQRIAVAVGVHGDDHVEISVLDDGPGLGPDMVDHAFERFVSLDGQGGSGLGLPIARGLARAHGGDLTYEDGFVLRLPRKAPVGCGGAARPGPLPRA
ncbi:MAG: PAS domain-containing sensor histidine kinase [Actinomycetota bacterium]|nr:PAS domain-containing sensor histidine kinase [Actinomycetota bacterium]